MRKLLIAVAVFLLVFGLFYWQFSVFVVQPIGAVPDGVTLVIRRLNRDAVKFVDSADAMCARQSGGVSLLCRGITLGAVVENADILLRLPYSQFLYDISTGGARYEN